MLGRASFEQGGTQTGQLSAAKPHITMLIVIASCPTDLGAPPCSFPPFPHQVDPYLSERYIGNTVRSYIYDVMGAWLYQKYAVMETPAAVAADYGVPNTTPGLGSMNGGMSPEGFLYGASMAHVIETLLAMHTAGWATPTLAGPQVRVVGPGWGGDPHPSSSQSQVCSRQQQECTLRQCAGTAGAAGVLVACPAQLSQPAWAS